MRCSQQRMRFLVLFLFAAAIAPAQIVSVGVKAGIPATDALPNQPSYNTLLDTGRWTIGPTVEVRLPYGLSLEADALYRGYRLQQSLAFPEVVQDGVTYPPFFNSSRSDTKVWDFPVLLKYRFGPRTIRPFVDAGYTWSHSTSDVTSSLTCLGTEAACNSSPLNSYFYTLAHINTTAAPSGPTAGVGVEFKLGRFKLAPEVRYTHFSNPTVNQVTILAGFTF